MKFEKISSIADQIEKKLGINPLTVPQGSPEWFKLKLGVISASNIEYVLAKKGGGGRMTYLCNLIAQVGTGLMPEVNAKQMEWGKSHEQAARSAYTLTTGNEVHEVAFLYKDVAMRSGASPDGLITELHGLELKCPFSSVTHAEFLCNEKIKPEYIKQCQFGMWTTGAEKWDFASYDPRFKTQMLKVVTLERDEDMMREFNEKVPEFIFEMDGMLNRAGIVFGSQWE